MQTTENKHIYQNSWQHLSDELARLDFCIQLAVMRLRQSLPLDPQDGFRGLYISDQEIDSILEERTRISAVKNKETENDRQMDRLVTAIEKLQKTILRRKKTSLEHRTHLSLPNLSHLFRLSEFEEQVVLICLAPELNRKYEKLFAYLQDDMTRKKPSVDLILNLLCSSQEEMVTRRSHFLPEATLCKSRILKFVEDSQNPGAPLLSRFIKLDDRIVNYLLGIRSLDERIESFSEVVDPKAKANWVRTLDELKQRLLFHTQDYLGNLKEQRGKLIYFVYGPYGSGKQSLANEICGELNVPLVISDMEELLASALPFEETIRLLFREALLQPATVYLKGFHRLVDEEEKYSNHLKFLARTIEEFSWLTFLAGEKDWEPRGFFNHNSFLKVHCRTPGYAERADLWRIMTDGQFSLSPEVHFEELATKFRFTQGQIKDALVATQNLTRMRKPDGSEIKMQDLYQGCRAQCNQKLDTLAQKITPMSTWADIVLPQETLQQLHTICAQVSYRHRVYDEWGFDRKLSLGKGVNALFSGPTGTGKTMAAEIIANELELDLYKIDLSSVVSKYIGETEKNLSKIFHEAESSNAILFFDEADALFGKRSEVKDSHDRYANIEIGYLLQKMEEYEGISILATNLKQNMDDAFLRRLHFLVEFPFPDAKYRYQIWKNIFPKETPVSEELDFNLLSSRLKVAGGNIKNIAVNAAFLAAGNSGAINMEHIIHATKQEYQKMGIPQVKTDFGSH